MTINEKLNEFFYTYAQREACKSGANWMLEKVSYWLQEHVNDYLFDDGVPGRPWLKCKSDMFDDFKKAMKE